MKVVRIPEERVGALIGSDGATKEQVEELTNSELLIDDAEVRIESDDPLEELRAQSIVKAIGRGFGIEAALRLLEDNAILAVIDISNFTETSNGKERLKGRVIGHNGESKEHIENTTDTELAIYGKTVSIIGNAANVEIAKNAVEILLDGSSHGTAWQYIEQNQHKLATQPVR